MPEDALGAAVGAARRRRGLSPNGLARAAGISRGALLLLESGGDVRRSTLERVLAVVAEVLPHEVLPGTEGRAASAASGPWRAWTRLHGVTGRLLRLHARLADGGRAALTREFRGLTAAGGAAAADELLRRAWRGTSGAPPGLVDGGAGGPQADHEVRAHVDRRGRVRLDCVQRESRVSNASPGGIAWLLELGLAAVVDLPLAELEIVITGCVPDGIPRFLAWAAPLVPDAGETDVAERLHPLGKGVTLRRAATGVRLRVRRPAVGHAYAVAFAPESAPRRPTRGSVVARARRESGLTVRELAARAALPPMTCADAEAGRDARLSTLRAVARALPTLSSWDLLGMSADDEEGSARRAWLWERDAHGCEIEEETKEVVVSDTGDAEVVIRTRGLRLLRPDIAGDLRIRVGHALPVVQPSRAKLEHVGTVPVRGYPEMRFGRALASDGTPAHVLVIPQDLARRGASYSRRLRHAGVYAMSVGRARGRVAAAEGPFVEGTSFAPFLPTRRLRLIVRWPRGFRPLRLRAGAWPLRALPEPDDDRTLRRVAPGTMRLRAPASGRTAILDVTRPMLGLKYGLSWELPE